MAVEVGGTATTTACVVKAAFKGETAQPPDLTEVMLVPPEIADGLAPKEITAFSRQA